MLSSKVWFLVITRYQPMKACRVYFWGKCAMMGRLRCTVCVVLCYHASLYLCCIFLRLIVAVRLCGGFLFLSSLYDFLSTALAVGFCDGCCLDFIRGTVPPWIVWYWRLYPSVSEVEVIKIDDCELARVSGRRKSRWIQEIIMKQKYTEEMTIMPKYWAFV